MVFECDGRSTFTPFSQRRAIALFASKGRSLFPPLSQKRAIYLLNSTSARSPFWLRMFLQGSAIALHLYQMPKVRSTSWN
ncbi:hypothetical protein QUB70_11675 [Microcoleus sp. A003_D6]|uniref:hypothetical protein n=1 Tax=Microcoleus sp. A003_D6 TaxID=3055266 RepID=UPI002FD6983A